MSSIRKLEIELVRRLPGASRKVITEVLDAWCKDYVAECMVQRTIDSPRFEGRTREYMKQTLGEYAVKLGVEEWDSETDVAGRAGQIKTLRLTVIKP